MIRPALTKAMFVATAAAVGGPLAGVVVWYFFKMWSPIDVAKASLGAAALAGLFVYTGSCESRKRAERREPCTGCEMELAGLEGEACPRCGLVRAARGVSPGGKGERLPCKSCGYDLTGNTSQACPECGVYVASMGTLQTLLSKNLGLSGWCACCGERVNLPPGEACPRCHSRFRSASKPANT